ncbi:chemotaxis protein CheC, partial [Clostridium sp.]
MSNGFLSQDEINSLLNGELNNDNEVENNEELLSDLEKDLLGEVGNISMGSASTALYQLLNQKVNITTPVVTVTTIKQIKENFDVPNIILDVEYVEGISGRNMLMMKISDAAVIANCMMGGDGKIESDELSEIEISA